MANRWGNNGKSDRLYFLGFQNHCRWWLQPLNLRVLAPWKKSYDQPRQLNKKLRHYFANKGLSRQSYVFSSSHVWMWELDYKESWAQKNWCFWTVVLRRLLIVHCTSRRSNQSILKEISLNIHWKDRPKAETSILWPPDVKNRLIGKDPDARKDWRQEEKGTTEDKMVGLHHWLD